MYTCTNQGGRPLERSPPHHQFPATSLCIPVALELFQADSILVEAHIQVPQYPLMLRNY